MQSSQPSQSSAVTFANRMRVHLALPTRDLEGARRFYEALFQQPPTKVRPGYAKFELAEPPLNFSLNEVTDIGGGGELAPPLPHHMGLQVKSTEAVASFARRMRDGGYRSSAEHQVACCYAVQDKVWLTDPDGHRWEVFVVTEAESEHFAPTPVSAEPVLAEAEDGDAAPCCGPDCCA